MTTWPLDPETNLPVLPEGEFWRVREILPERRAFMRLPDLMHLRAYVQVQHIKIVERERLVIDRPGGFGRRVVTHTERVEEEEVVGTSSIEVEGTPGPDGYVVYDTSVTPELILTAAITVMDMREKRRITESLFGDYPPKKLEV